MTREDIFKSGDPEQIAQVLCDLMEETADNAWAVTGGVGFCQMCPAADDCSVGETGFRKWMRREAGSWLD